MEPAIAGPPLFPGGFLLTEGPELPQPLAHASEPPEDLLDLIDGWRTLRLGRHVLRFDESWPLALGEQGTTSLVLLGTAVDVDDPALDDADIAQRLAAAADRSWEAFLDALDVLGGAHLIFLRTGGRTFVLQDATGVEALCYDVSGGPLVVASHPALIAELRGYATSELARWWLAHPIIRLGGYYFPGLRTAFDELRILTPNTLLDLDTLEVSRFFPREPLRGRSVSDIVDETSPRLRNQYQRLLGDGPVAVSLSGGLDTRLTLAAGREAAQDVRWFTYVVWNSGVHQSDITTATQLAERLELPHETYRIRRGDAVAPHWERTHLGTQGGDALAAGMVAHYPRGHLHVRSNVLETVRGFYLKNSINHGTGFDANKLARLFRTTVAREFTPHFEEFCAITGFGPDVLNGIHYSDLFYWEHRMGAWHGGMVRGLKLSHRTHTLYNCRAILTSMMARPLQDRARATVVWALMDEMWPEVLDTPIFSGSHYIEPPTGRRLRR